MQLLPIRSLPCVGAPPARPAVRPAPCPAPRVAAAAPRARTLALSSSGGAEQQEVEWESVSPADAEKFERIAASLVARMEAMGPEGVEDEEDDGEALFAGGEGFTMRHHTWWTSWVGTTATAPLLC
jgi:hypothetical protein